MDVIAFAKDPHLLRLCLGEHDILHNPPFFIKRFAKSTNHLRGKICLCIKGAYTNAVAVNDAINHPDFSYIISGDWRKQLVPASSMWLHVQHITGEECINAEFTGMFKAMSVFYPRLQYCSSTKEYCRFDSSFSYSNYSWLDCLWRKSYQLLRSLTVLHMTRIW